MSVTSLKEIAVDWDDDERLMQKTMAEWYIDDVYRQVIEVLAIIAPDTPFPLSVLEKFLKADLWHTDEFQPCEEAQALTHEAFDQALFALEEHDLIDWDLPGDTAIVTIADQTELRDKLRHLRQTLQALVRKATTWYSVKSQLLVSMHDYACIVPECYNAEARTMLALITPHLVHFATQELQHPEQPNSLISIFTILWLLEDKGAVSELVLTTQTQRFLTACAVMAPQWEDMGDNSTFEYLTDVISSTTHPDASQIVEHLFALAKHVIQPPADV